MQKWTNLVIVLAAWVLLCVGCWIGLKVLELVPHTLLIFSLGGLVAYALDPLVEGLRKLFSRGSNSIMTRELSVTVVMVSLLVVVGASLALLGGKVVSQVRSAQQDAPTYRARAEAFAAQTDLKLANSGIRFSLLSTIRNPPPDVVAAEAKVTHELVPLVEHTAKDIGESVIVLLIGTYFLIYGNGVRVGFNKSLPEELATRAALWQTDVNRILGGFVRGQLTIALVIGVAASIFCLAMGLKFWLLIGVFVAAASLIPVFGPYIGALPAIVAALIGPTRFGSHIGCAIAVVVFFIVVNEIGSKVLYPKLVGAALGLHALLVLFVLFAGLEIGGVIGVLFAAPLAALAWVTVTHLYRYWQNLPDSLVISEIVPAARDRKKRATS